MMNSLSLYLFFLVPLTAIAMSTSISATTLGVTYSPPATVPGSVQLSPNEIAAKFVSMKIQAVRLLDSTPAMIGAFAYTNVSLLLSVPNSLVPTFASNRSLAMHWIHLHVLPFHRRTKISTISVGNDVISHSPDVSPLFLLRAMQNVHVSLADLRINSISVSTTFAFFDIIPSSPNGEVLIRPILQFLNQTNSSLLISLCPYNMFRSSCSIPIGIDLFEKLVPLNFRDNLTVGVTVFRNLFDMMVHVVVSSMAVTGHENLPLIVAETGWPRSGIDASETDASELLLKALRAHLSKEGPLKKETASEVYMYELVDEDSSLGNRNKGLFNYIKTGNISSSVRGREYWAIWYYLGSITICFFIWMVGIGLREMRREVRDFLQMRRRRSLLLRLEERRDVNLRECEDILSALLPIHQGAQIYLDLVRKERNTISLIADSVRDLPDGGITTEEDIRLVEEYMDGLVDHLEIVRLYRDSVRQRSLLLRMEEMDRRIDAIFRECEDSVAALLPIHEDAQNYLDGIRETRNRIISIADSVRDLPDGGITYERENIQFAEKYVGKVVVYADAVRRYRDSVRRYRAGQAL